MLYIFLKDKTCPNEVLYFCSLPNQGNEVMLSLRAITVMKSTMTVLTDSNFV